MTTMQTLLIVIISTVLALGIFILIAALVVAGAINSLSSTVNDMALKTCEELRYIRNGKLRVEINDGNVISVNGVASLGQSLSMISNVLHVLLGQKTGDDLKKIATKK